ncbi:MAG: hypothetical protein JSS82_14625 [Bacteroidetes bacterium]|nr:hypothetical protein [Bacteroidota bacterium]
MNGKTVWVKICLIHLCIVAFLGTLLRSKILFSLPWIDFKNLVNAHSHFAFGGWVTLVLMVLMICDLLPNAASSQKVYQWILGGIVFNAWGMLLSFPFEGYAFFSILFSTLFIFVTYIFSYVFIRDILKAPVGKTVKLLAVSSLICLVLSSIGPFTLAYLLASKSGNFLLYKDSIYTYLHFQYNGFFTLSVFSILFWRLTSSVSAETNRKLHQFAVALCVSILPSVFLSYLWQYPENTVRIIAIIGVASLLACVIFFARIFLSVHKYFLKKDPLIRILGTLSLIAFTLKLLLQSGTIIPSLGNAVFGNRPVIIGFLHLVFLGFVSLFALAYLLQNGLLQNDKITRIALAIFAAGVIGNELVLMTQGLGGMFMQSSAIFPWLLWIIAVSLFVSTFLLASAQLGKKQR